MEKITGRRLLKLCLYGLVRFGQWIDLWSLSVRFHKWTGMRAIDENQCVVILRSVAYVSCVVITFAFVWFHEEIESSPVLNIFRLIIRFAYFALIKDN